MSIFACCLDRLREIRGVITIYHISSVLLVILSWTMILERVGKYKHIEQTGYTKQISTLFRYEEAWMRRLVAMPHNVSFPNHEYIALLFCNAGTARVCASWWSVVLGAIKYIVWDLLRSHSIWIIRLEVHEEDTQRINLRY